MRPRRIAGATALVGLVALVVPMEPPAPALAGDASLGPAGCAIPADRPVPGSGKVRRARTAEYPTVSAAVRAAQAGDTILIPPGVYRETVVVADDVDEGGNVTRRRDGLRIRGMDRARVVFDGAVRDPLTGELDDVESLESAFMIRSDRVVVENLTVRHYTRDPVSWYQVEGFWGRYLTIYGAPMINGASGSRCGQLDHVFAAGMGTAGLAVAGCFPCDTTVVDSVAQDSFVGLAALNARGGLHIGRPGTPSDAPRQNIARRNMTGVLVANEDPTPPAPGVGDAETAAALEHEAGSGPWVSGNLVDDNDNGAGVFTCGGVPGCGMPRQTVAGSLGIGIYVLGERAARVEANTVSNHDRYGIGVFGFPAGWPAIGNVVVANKVSGTRSEFDLVQDVSAGPGNCWSGNDGKEAPAGLQVGWACRPDVTTPPGGVPAAEMCTTKVVNCHQSYPPQEDATETWGPQRWHEYNRYGDDITDPRAWLNQPDDDRDRSYTNDGAVDDWLPEVRPYCGPGGFTACAT